MITIGLILAVCGAGAMLVCDFETPDAEIAQYRDLIFRLASLVAWTGVVLQVAAVVVELVR